MLLVDARQAELCNRCGALGGVDGPVVHNPSSDPLQVAECSRCGSILDIGTRDW